MSGKTAAERLDALLPTVGTVFCVCQPILDILVFFATERNLSTLPMAILRVSLAVTVFVLGFLLTKRKWAYGLFVLLALAYLTGHVLSCRRYGLINLTEDLSEQLRIWMLPALTVGFVTLMRRNSDVLRAVKKGLLINLAIILASEILSLITKTEPYTYTDKDLGFRGWFLWPNSQSAIVSLMAPIVILYALQRWKGRLVPLLLVCVSSFAILYFNATRLAYASLVGTGIGLFVCLLAVDRRRIRQAGLILTVALLFAALYPFSPMRETRRQMAQNTVIKQRLIDEAAAEYGVPVGAGRTTDLDALAAAYHYDLQGVVDRFGIEATAKQYDYTLNAETIFDKRLKRLNFYKLLMAQAPVSSWLFGLEIGTTRQETEMYDFYRNTWTPDVEIFEMEYDLYSICYYCGAVGTLLILGMIVLVGVRAAVRFLKDYRNVLTVDFAVFAMAYGICMVYGCLTISVVRQTNASVFFAVVMAALWVLSEGQKRPDTNEAQ